MIHRFESKDDTGNLVGTLSEMSVVLSQVEVPPPYSGDYPNSRAIVDPNEGLTDLGTLATVPSGTPPAIDQPDFGYEGLIRCR